MSGENGTISHISVFFFFLKASLTNHGMDSEAVYGAYVFFLDMIIDCQKSYYKYTSEGS